jgi:hypothetical protein
VLGARRDEATRDWLLSRNESFEKVVENVCVVVG